MSTMKTADAAATDVPAKKRPKKLVMIIGVLLLVAGGAGYLMLGSGKGSSAPAKPTPGKVVPLDAITVNLAGGHYLKVQMALQLSADAGEKVDGSQAQDLAISEFSNRQVAELSSTDGRTKAKDDLLHAVSKAYDDKVIDIYFTGFVMQ